MVEIERVYPEKDEHKFLFQEHIVRYAFASNLVKGKSVLDAACGTGYGSSLMLERGSSKVVGIDNSSEAIQFCKKNFSKKNLEFHIAECTKLPFSSKEFDAVVSFETIEHLKNQNDFLSEISRVLTTDGVLIISTPNLSTYEEKNLFHEHELNLDEFQSLLKKFFTNVIILKQFYPSAMFIGDFDNSQIIESQLIKNKTIPKDLDELYFVAICSNNKIPKIPNQIVVFDESNLVEGKYSHLKELQTRNQKNEQHLKELQTRNQKNEQHLKELQTRNQKNEQHLKELHSLLEQTIKDKDAYLEQTIKDKDAYLEQTIKDKDAYLEQTIKDKDDVIKHHENAIYDHKNQIKEIRTSKSWRILHPFDNYP